ncbi:MAG: DUF502 domain-containing protein [Puniceicoccales bacterium]|jgi:uncharacterized membrane protein|nr:DUF502 domain-containing protein [Puniceicoccales bacterium]
MVRSIRNAFFSGLLILLPLGITVFLVTLLIDTVGAPASKLFFRQLHSVFRNAGIYIFAANCVATILVLIFITLIGYVSRYFFGRFIIRLTEKVITKLPFIRTLYNTTKQIVGTFSGGKRAVFQRAIMIEFPRKGTYSIGFQMGKATGELQRPDVEQMLCVFIPTTPNPTSGFLVFVEENQCISLNMSIADAMKAIISGGALIPSGSSPVSQKSPSVGQKSKHNRKISPPNQRNG